MRPSVMRPSVLFVACALLAGTAAVLAPAPAGAGSRGLVTGPSAAASQTPAGVAAAPVPAPAVEAPTPAAGERPAARPRTAKTRSAHQGARRGGARRGGPSQEQMMMQRARDYLPPEYHHYLQGAGGMGGYGGSGLR